MTNNKKISILLLFVMFLFQACSEKDDKKNIEIKKEQKIIEVKINTIKKQAYPIWLDFSGKTQASKNVEIISRVQGELKEVLFNAGHRVKEGDVLFKIDDTEYKIILAQKESNLQKNKAQLNLAIANVKRYEPLVKKELVSREKLDELIAKKNQLQSQLAVDIALVDQALLNVQYCTIKATIDGQIGKSILDVGNIIKKDSKLVNIVQTSSLFVNFNPSSNEVSLLKKYKSQENPKLIVIPENANKQLELTGTLDFIDNVTNENTGTVALRGTVINKDNILFPGTFVDIKLFLTDKIEFIAIHPNTISQNQLGSYVLLVNDQNKIQIRQIIITYKNQDIAIIKEGLKEGDRVVVSAINKLKEDQKVSFIQIANMIKK